MKLHRNNRGIALPIVLIIALILTILGTVLWHYSVRDLIFAEKNLKRMQAYYIARSGADAVAQYIVDNPDGIDMKEYVDALVNSPKSYPTSISGDPKGYFEIEVTRDSGKGIIIIQSVGTVDEISQKVSLTLYELVTGEEPLFDMAVFSNTAIELKGSARIEGDVGINSLEPGSVVLAWSTAIDGNLFIAPDADPEKILTGARPNPRDNITNDILEMTQERVYGLPPFPDFPEDLSWRGSFTVGWNPSPPYHIYEDGEYDSITVKSELVIHVGDEDRILRVNSLEVSGSGKITLNRTGKGRLYLYVNDNFNITNGATINNDGDPGDIFIYYKGNSPVNPSGSTKIVGCLYAEKADIVISESGGITGHIITGGENVSIIGDAEANVRALYAPLARIVVANGARFRGALVCDSLTVTGNSRVIYDNSIQDTFPDIWMGGEEDTITYARGQWQ